MEDKETSDGRERVLVIVPAYNEARNVTPVIRGVGAALPEADVLVVDDGSADDTAAVARSAGARIISHAVNLGYGGALQTGFKYALAGGYDYVIHLDGDGQHEPAGARDILRELKADVADVVIGSRYLLGPPAWMGRWRRLGSQALAMVTSWIVGQAVTDPTSGFQGCNRRAARFFAQDMYPVDFPDADVVIMVERVGLRIREIPVTMYGRASGRSMHTGMALVYYAYKMALAIALTLVRGYPTLEWEA